MRVAIDQSCSAFSSSADSTGRTAFKAAINCCEVTGPPAFFVSDANMVATYTMQTIFVLAIEAVGTFVVEWFCDDRPVSAAESTWFCLYPVHNSVECRSYVIANVVHYV